MANLLGQNIGTNYKGILNLDTINTPLDATLRAVTDGEGNASPLQLSTDAVSIGAISEARFAIKGTTTTSATTALLVQNSAGQTLLKANDNRDLYLGSSNSNYIHQGTFFQGNYYGAGNWMFGTLSDLGARLGIKGSGTTSATTSLLVQNSAGTQALKVTDDGITSFGTNSNINAISNKLSIYNIASSFLKVDQQTGFGTNFTATERVKIQGMGSTFATTALLVQNSAGADSFKITDDGNSVLSGIQFQTGNTIRTSAIRLVTFSGGVCAAATPAFAHTSAILEGSSTTKGFLPPRMTTTQKNAIATPASGLIVYDETTNKLACYNGTTWNDLF